MIIPKVGDTARGFRFRNYQNSERMIYDRLQNARIRITSTNKKPMKKTITTLAAILALTACEKMNITVHPEPKKEPTGPKITYTKEGPCTSAQIEGLHTKSLTPTVEIKTRKGTDSLWGQTQPEGPIYISFCLENDKRLRRSLRRRSTTIIVTDEDGTKTTIKKGRY